MINPFADMLNKTFNKKILHTNDLKADENIEYPPGIINCRDPAIKTAYRLSCMNQGHYLYEYNKEIGAILAGVLALKKSWVPDFGRILLDTPFKEPAYWYICAKIDDYPHGKYKNNILNYSDFKKINIEIKPENYLLGLCDTIGELRRITLENIKNDNIEDAEKYYKFMEELYDFIMTFDCYNIVDGLRRKQDISRSLLEKTNGDLVYFIENIKLREILKNR